MQNKIAMGISFPKKMIRSIDRERGDISRSRFVLRLLEQVYEEKKQKNSVEQCDDVQVGAMHRPVSYTTDSTSEPQSTLTEGMHDG
jgi:metal-responsive CopG/Arc/MetJ family transcriptional regulator